VLIVSDTSPINLLVQLGHTDVLPALFNDVIIPLEVKNELNHQRTPVVVRRFIANPPPWLTILTPKSSPHFPDIDTGESAAIQLAIELGALLLVDEKDARAVAKANGVRVIGAVGVLERAADSGLIADLAAVHALIRALPFHVSDSILDQSLARHLARKQSSP
jgi:predicted nucleic acid-binding protein